MPQYVPKRTLEVKLVLNFARKTRDWVILSYYRLLTPRKVRQLYNIFSNHPQGAMIISELDAYRLYRHVRVNRFSKCLEFGGGNWDFISVYRGCYAAYCKRFGSLVGGIT